MGYFVSIDGSAAEVRFATLHTIASPSVMWNKHGVRVIDNEFHRKHRDEYLAAAETHNLVKAFASGMDVHIFGTSLILDKDPKDVTPEERKDGKFVTLGRQYKRGSDAIAAQYGMDPRIMRDRVAKWDATFPEFGHWHHSVEKFVNTEGYVTSLFQLIRRLPEIWYSDHMLRADALREAVNAPVQGDSHMWISKAITWLNLNVIDKTRGLRSCLINDVHDAQIWDVPDNELDFMAIKVAQSMLIPYFDVDNYPWVVSDLAGDLEIMNPWGKKRIKVQFDTSQMVDKHRPDFSLEDECARIWFDAKPKFKYD